ncbi:uncharacterized protein MKK02DRAFT_40505 [Dioszegia hungarica]|uniref:Uncharacterized protein n=1 Tax=Dioszegia hungarica TaxID=4972 RepID=A0AA38LQP0_9TREE|nr:uncharacterized protein MKK02DRAFT_40505 [Dioszegia hungarica]KAI9632205.1 hypothetical protein MKK02DRAFT_40505 [Dioszegia hungarica]
MSHSGIYFARRPNKEGEDCTRAIKVTDGEPHIMSNDEMRDTLWHHYGMDRAKPTLEYENVDHLKDVDPVKYATAVGEDHHFLRLGHTGVTLNFRVARFENGDKELSAVAMKGFTLLDDTDELATHLWLEIGDLDAGFPRDEFLFDRDPTAMSAAPGGSDSSAPAEPLCPTQAFVEQLSKKVAQLMLDEGVSKGDDGEQGSTSGSATPSDPDTDGPDKSLQNAGHFAEDIRKMLAELQLREEAQ